MKEVYPGIQSIYKKNMPNQNPEKKRTVSEIFHAETPDTRDSVRNAMTQNPESWEEIEILLSQLMVYARNKESAKTAHEAKTSDYLRDETINKLKFVISSLLSKKEHETREKVLKETLEIIEEEHIKWNDGKTMLYANVWAFRNDIVHRILSLKGQDKQ